MPIRLPSHLHRARSGILHFRIAVPPDLKPCFTTREIYRSLRTASVRDAVPAAQMLAEAVKRTFQQLRSHTMSKQKKTPTDPFDGSEWGLIPEISFDEFMRPRLKLIPEPGDTPEDRVQAQVDFLRAVGVAGAGGQTGAGIPAPNQASSTVPEASTGIVAATTLVLSSYVEPYLANAFVAAKPTEKTLDSYRSAISLFIDIVGDKALHALGVTDQNLFEDTIGKVPANRTKIASTRALSLDQMIALDVPKLSPQSTKNIAQRTNNFLNWAFRREGGKPPFELMGNVRITTRSKTVNRRAFRDDELRILFNPATYAQGRQQSPYMYWLPLIGLHTGMRINEIAQLALADIGWHDGIACFHVTDDDADNAQDRRAKRVKTNAGRRIVPVHDALVSLGLLDYAHTIRQDGHNVLFPELIGGRDGPGQPASKQFARYCDRVGLRDPDLVFHSFRHGAVGRMRTAGIAKELRMVVVGHSPAEDTHDGYGDIKNDFNIGDRKRAVDALNFDQVLDYIALSELRPGKSDLNVALARARSR
jgi:integrase